MTTPAPQPADPYASIVDLYDLEHDPFTADVELLVNIAQIIGDPILEVGCGSGRILRPIADAGFRVVGIDTSTPMLAKADLLNRSTGLDERIRLHNIDMRNADQAPGGPFGLVIFSLNSLMHLSSPDDQRRALENARKALDPRGQLIIDTMNPTPDAIRDLLSGPHLEGSWTMDDGTTIDKWSHRKPGAAPQVIDTLLWYDSLAADGTVRRTRTAFPLRYMHASELTLMLEVAGFVEPMLYGSYELDPFEQDSERLLVTAEVTPSRGAAR